MILCARYMALPATNIEMLVQVCTLGQGAHGLDMDYADFLNLLAIYMLMSSALFLIFFENKLKQIKVEEKSPDQN